VRQPSFGAPCARAISRGDIFLAPDGAGVAAVGASALAGAAGLVAGVAPPAFRAPCCRANSKGDNLAPPAGGGAPGAAGLATGGFAAAAPPAACARAISSGLMPPGLAAAAGFVGADAAAGFAAASFVACLSGAAFFTGASTTLKYSGSMSYQLISTGPSNCTKARPAMFTVFTTPVSDSNRFSSAIPCLTTTYLSVSWALSFSAISIDMVESLRVSVSDPERTDDLVRILLTRRILGQESCEFKASADLLGPIESALPEA